MPSLAALAARRHVHELARQHDVSLHWCDTWSQAETFAALREVRIPWIEGGDDYLIALHELGHVVAPGAQQLEASARHDVFTNLALEGLAWAWAAHVCDTSLLEPEDWDTPLFALWTHYEKELEGRGLVFPQDPSDPVVSQSDPNSSPA